MNAEHRRIRATPGLVLRITGVPDISLDAERISFRGSEQSPLKLGAS